MENTHRAAKRRHKIAPGVSPGPHVVLRSSPIEAKDSVTVSAPGVRRFAGPVRRVFQAAVSLVFRILRVGAQRTCETLGSGSHHLAGSDALFDPFLQRTDGVKGVPAGT